MDQGKLRDAVRPVIVPLNSEIRQHICDSPEPTSLPGLIASRFLEDGRLSLWLSVTGLVGSLPEDLAGEGSRAVQCPPISTRALPFSAIERNRPPRARNMSQTSIRIPGAVLQHDEQELLFIGHRVVRIIHVRNVLGHVEECASILAMGRVRPCAPSLQAVPLHPSVCHSCSTLEHEAGKESSRTRSAHRKERNLSETHGD